MNPSKTLGIGTSSEIKNNPSEKIIIQPSSSSISPTEAAIWTSELPKYFKENEMFPITLLSQSERSLILLIEDKSQKRYILKYGNREGTLSKEAQCLSNLRHPNIASLCGSFLYGQAIFLQFQKAPGACLMDILLEEGPFSESEAQFICKELVSAVSFLHKNNYAHRDIKPDNIIYDRNTHSVTLIDFEFSCKFSTFKKHHSSVGTLEYQAPEVRREKYKGPEADIWSLGVTFYVLMTGSYPFRVSDLEKNTEIFYPPNNLSTHCSNLLERMLTQNPRHRIAIRNIKKHYWIKRNVWERTHSEPIHEIGLSTSLSLTSREVSTPVL